MYHFLKKATLLCLLATMFACGGKKEAAKDNNAPNDTQPPVQTTVENTPPPAPEPVDGGSFNKYFPKTEGDFEVVFTQEKDGFAQAKLKKGGSEVATLTVSDVVKNADAVTDYAASSKKVANFPAVAKGSLGTAVLVENRFQVQVRSKDKSFSEADRETWLQKFDLASIAKLKVQ
jgi:hypothetical protein